MGYFSAIRLMLHKYSGERFAFWQLGRLALVSPRGFDATSKSPAGQAAGLLQERGLRSRRCGETEPHIRLPVQ
jgi:hypothetical protein